jgi:hypothetical protein
MNGEGVNDEQEWEIELGQHLLSMALLSAHFVEAAEAAGMGPDEINRHLAAVAEKTGLEFWITDEWGYAYLRSNIAVRFRFKPNSTAQPQASEFWPILTGELDSYVQDAQVREIDQRIYKYAAVRGTDKARIVQVGQEMRHAERQRHAGRQNH